MHNLLVRRLPAVLVSVMLFTLGGQNAATAQTPPPPATLAGKYGIFITYLSNKDSDSNRINDKEPSHPGGLEKDVWEGTVKSFSRNIDNFVGDVKRTGAQYVVFTIGQNTDNFAAPNKILDQAAANALAKPELATEPDQPGPGIVTSKTDLIGEMADKLKEAGIGFYVYFAEDSKYDGKNGNGWIAVEQGVIQEYARTWKDKKIDGWWIDGCYSSLVKDRFGTSKLAKESTDKLIDAAQSQNPNSLVFCNSEASTFRYWSERQGAIGGEENFFHRLPDPDLNDPKTSFAFNSDLSAGPDTPFANLIPDPKKPLSLDGKPVQWHVAVPLGSGYGLQDLDRFNQFYSETYLPRYIKKVTELGGAVTVDMAVTSDGRLIEKQLAVMDEVKRHVGGEPLPTNTNLALGKIAFLKSNTSPTTLQPEQINVPGVPVFAWPLFGNNGKVDEYYSKPDSKSYGAVAWNYMVDLEQASQFDQVKVTFLNDVSPSSYIVETSNDLNTDGTIKWNLSNLTKAPTPTPGAANTYTFEIPNVTARYVRLKAPNAQTGQQMAIKEFEVYNGALTP